MTLKACLVLSRHLAVNAVRKPLPILPPPLPLLLRLSHHQSSKFPKFVPGSDADTVRQLHDIIQLPLGFSGNRTARQTAPHHAIQSSSSGSHALAFSPFSSSKPIGVQVFKGRRLKALLQASSHSSPFAHEDAVLQY